MDEERDCVVFEDEEGNELTLDVLDYFFYIGQEYAILADLGEEEAEGEACSCEDEACQCHHHECGCGDDSCDACGEETDIYIMKVVTEGDFEEFVPVEENLVEEIEAFVEKKMQNADVEDFEEE